MLYDQNIELIFLKEPQINTVMFRETASQTISKVGNEIADVYIEATNKVLMILAEKQIKAYIISAKNLRSAETQDVCRIGIRRDIC